jgi:hypothetical protein
VLFSPREKIRGSTLVEERERERERETERERMRKARGDDA